MREWLAANGPWVVPLMTILGVAAGIAFRLYQLSKGRNSQSEERASIRRRIVRLFVLTQQVAKVFFGIAGAIFAFALISVSSYHADNKPVPKDLVASCVDMTLFCICIAIVGGLILLVGKYGEEWFKD